jgi:hypothetical protein
MEPDNMIPVSKWLLWKSPSEKQLYVFIGKGTMSPDLMKSVASGVELTKKEQAELKSAWGDQYEERLGLSLASKHGSDIQFISEWIFPDDPIYIARIKVSAVIGSTTTKESVYIWTEEPVTEQAIDAFLAPLFSGTTHYELASLVEEATKWFTVSSEFSPPRADVTTKVGYQEAKTYLQNNVVKHASSVTRPLEVEYMTTQWKRYHGMDANPFEGEALQPDSNFVDAQGEYRPRVHLNDNSRQWIGTTNDCFHFTTAEHLKRYAKAQAHLTDAQVINGVLKKYMPKMGSDPKPKPVDKLNELVRKEDALIWSLLYKPLSEPQSSYLVGTHTDIRRLYFRVQSPKPMFFDTKIIFRNTQTSEDVPFIEFRDFSNNFYRIFKGAFKCSDGGCRLTQSMLTKWTDPTANKQQQQRSNKVLDEESAVVYNRQSTSIRFKVYFGYHDGIHNYFTLVLHDYGAYDLKYTFDATTHVSYAQVLQSFPKVNVVLQQVCDLLSIPQSTLTPIKEYMLSDPMPSIVEVFDFETATAINFQKEIASSKAAKQWFERVPFIDALSTKPGATSKSTELLYKYKRVPNYVTMDTISSFIHMNFHLSKEEIIDRLQQEFRLDREEATSAFEEHSDKQLMEISKRQPGLRFKPKYNNGATFAMTASGAVQVSFTVKGNASMGVRDKLARLIYYGWVSPFFEDLQIKNDKAFLRNLTTMVQEKVDDGAVTLKDVISTRTSSPVPQGDNNGNGDDDDDDWGADVLDDIDIDDIDGDDVGEDDDDTEAAALQSTEGGATDGKSSGEYGHVIIKELVKADKELFKSDRQDSDATGKNKPFSRICGSIDKRQPVPITEEQKKYIDDNFPKSYEGYVRTGSNEVTANKYYYICPRIWCPHSKVSLTEEDLKRLDGKCPIGEPPLILHSKYWERKKKGSDDVDIITKVPGFLNPKDHPKGLLMPCCFKKDKADVRARQQEKEAKRAAAKDAGPVPPQAALLDEDAAVVEEEDPTSKDRYILQMKGAPIDNGRYGMLPDDLADYFQSNQCYNLMKDEMPCFIRKGIQQDANSFITAVLQTLHISELQTTEDFLKVVEEHLTPSDFIRLNNGNSVKVFYNENARIDDDDNFHRFQRWFMAQTEYHVLFGLKKLATFIRDTSSFEALLHKPDHGKHVNAIYREYIIYNAFTNFMYYLHSNVHKHHDDLLDLFDARFSWLNKREYNILVIEHAADNKTLLHCPKFIGTRQSMDITKPYVMILKVGKHYEPIQHIVLSHGNIRETKAFKYFGNDFVKRIADFYDKNCKSPESKQWTHARKVQNALYAKGYVLSHVVLTLGFKMCGFLLEEGIYVPLKSPAPVASGNAFAPFKYVYLHDMLSKVKPTVSEKDVSNVFNMLYKELGDAYYKVSGVLKDGDTAYAVELSSTTVPLSTKPKYFPFIEQELLNEQLLTGVVTPHSATVEGSNSYAGLLERVIRGILKKNQLQDKLKTIKHPSNPLPRFVKLRQLRDIARSIIPSDVSSTPVDMFLDDIANDLLTKDVFYLMKQALRDIKTNDQEVIFDQHDIFNQKLVALFERMANPYKYVFSSSEDYIQTIPITFVEARARNLGLLIQGNLTDIKPSRWQTELGGFQRYEHPDNLYTNDYIVEVFMAIAKQMRSKVTKQMLRDVVTTSLRKALSVATLRELDLKNTSFRKLVDKMDTEEVYTMKWEQLEPILQHAHYRWSFYEIREIARFLNINVIFLGRQNELKLPNGIDCNYHGSQVYVLFNVNYLKKMEKFDIIVKATTQQQRRPASPQLAHTVIDFSHEFIEKISQYCSKIKVRPPPPPSPPSSVIRTRD